MICKCYIKPYLARNEKKILTKFKLLAALVMINIGALKDY